MPLNGALHVIWLQLVLPVWAWWWKLEIVQTSMIGPLLMPCPLVVTVHDGLDFHPEWRPSAIWSAYVRSIGAIAARRAAVVVTVSQAAAADVVRFFRISPDRLEVVWNGAQATFRDQSECPVDGLVARSYALVVGSPARYKNLGAAVEAIETVRRRYPSIQLVIVGPGLELLRRGSDWLFTPGLVSDEGLGWLYQNAAVCCVPSFHEGFGLPVLEALICGTPVVASDIPALREVGGAAVRYADPCCPDEFAAEVIEILEDQEAERRRIDPFVSDAATRTWKQTAAEMVAIYARVLERRAG